jgi:methionyl-tRNA formyltransferase
MNQLTIIFFGSTQDSTLVLEKLTQTKLTDPVQIVGVVTQPPRPIGREQKITPTPVEIWANQHNLTVLSFPSDTAKPWLYHDEKEVINTLQTLKADLLVSACYGQKIPFQIIQSAQFGGLNVHPSLLPRWRGADPVPWAIVAGDAETGVSVVTLSEHFDEGKIAAQKTHFLKKDAYPDTVRTELFAIGADLLCSILPEYTDGKVKMVSQDSDKATVARRLFRDDGFTPWDLLMKATTGEEAPTEMLPKLFQEASKHALVKHSVPSLIEQASRGLSPWPGLWTKITIDKNEKRLKILRVHLDEENLVIDEVQLEGKKPVSWTQFKLAYL